jgi:hypothetical protein
MNYILTSGEENTITLVKGIKCSYNPMFHKLAHSRHTTEFLLMKRGTKLWTAIIVCLHVNPCPVKT